MERTDSGTVKLVKITGRVPEDIRIRAKIRATERRVNLEDWVAEAVREKLAREAEDRIIPMERRR